MLVAMAAAPAVRADGAWWDAQGVTQADFNHDGSKLITAVEHGPIVQWDVESGEPNPRGPLTADGKYVMSRDGRLLLLVSRDGGVSIHDATTAEQVSRLDDVELG